MRFIGPTGWRRPE